MKDIAIEYRHSLIDDEALRQLADRLAPEIGRLRDVRADGYETPYASINLPGDVQQRAIAKQLAQEKLRLRPTVLVVVGIGGSNLGTLAVYEALRNLYDNDKLLPLKIYFADTVDSDAIGRLLDVLDRELRSGNKIIINVVSKSGRTTETIANFEILYELLCRHAGSAAPDQVVVTTDEGSDLWHLAGDEKFARLAVPKHVGGRYSVFSAVGLFPLALCGIDVDELCAGAARGLDLSTSEDLFANPAALRAALLCAHYQRGIRIHDTFVFSVDLEGVGRWYRQLMGESIGKAHDRKGSEVHMGITPTVSVGSTDLHSVGQLYLGGPYDRLTTFVGVERNTNEPVVPDLPKYDKLVANIQGRTLASIMDAILAGVQRAYEGGKRPFMTMMLPGKSPWYIGQLLQVHMVEIMYLGCLLNVDPFDQPQVELYKRETREILSHG